MKKIVYISDFFIEQNLGGAEICDEVIMRHLKQENYEVTKVLTKFVTINLINSNKDAFFIISNFIGLPRDIINHIINSKVRYIIYEHDHKYIKSRNPADYKDYLAPQQDIVNKDFYAGAVKVVAQTNFHKEIIEKNLKLENIITFSTNFWFEEHYEFMTEVSQRDKFELVGVMDSPIWHKNTGGSVETCKKLKKPYILISDSNYLSFLEKIGTYSSFIFLPKTPETFSRTCAEARMMNVQVIGNNNIGCLKEEWFKKYKGVELINYLKKYNIEAIKNLRNFIEG
jgi:hypothetical protein